MTYVRIEGRRCVYCGDTATQTDHFPPQCVEPRDGWLLPCCSECNVVAGAMHPYDFKSRVLYVKDALRDRHHHLLKIFDEAMHQHERVEWDTTAYIASSDLPKRLLENLEPQPEPRIEPEIDDEVDDEDHLPIRARRFKEAKVKKPIVKLQCATWMDTSSYEFFNDLHAELSRHFTTKIKLRSQPGTTMIWFWVGRECWVIDRITAYSIWIYRNHEMEAQPRLAVSQPQG